MEKFKTITKTVEEVHEYICDCCGTSTLFPDGTTNWNETQEMLHWRTVGGYGSIFGDGTEISLDLCQTCLKTRLGDCLQVVEPDSCHKPKPSSLLETALSHYYDPLPSTDKERIAKG